MSRPNAMAAAAMAKGWRHSLEDILICVDVDSEMNLDLNASASSPYSRMDAAKQLLLLFVYSKLQMDSRHAFSLMTLKERPYWVLKGFTSDLSSLNSAIQSIRTGESYKSCDLNSLIQLASAESRVNQNIGRTLRVLLIYGRSVCMPQIYNFRQSKLPILAADFIYLHNECTDHNQPQKIFDALIDGLESASQKLPIYIFETCNVNMRSLLRNACVFLAHPLQRGEQEGMERLHNILQHVEVPALPAQQPEKHNNTSSSSTSSTGSKKKEASEKKKSRN